MVETTTPYKLNKGGRAGVPVNPYWLPDANDGKGGSSIVAHRVRRVSIGLDYAKTVNRQRDREGKPVDFVAVGLWGGKGRHKSASLVYHEDRPDTLMVCFKPTQDQAGERVPLLLDELTDTLTGLPVRYDDLAHWLPSKGSNAEGQGLERGVDWQIIKLAHVNRLSVDGFAIVNDEGREVERYTIGPDGTISLEA